MTEKEKYWTKELNATPSEKYKGRWDVNGNVHLFNKNLTVLPIRFGVVTGNFFCSRNKLETLENAPIEVGRNFRCAWNKLKTLEGSPIKVGGIFSCTTNILETLEGAPREVGASFYCDDNNLTSLKGLPKYIGGNTYFYNNPLEHLNDLNNVQIKGEICICENDFDSIIKALQNTNLKTLEYTLHNHTYWFQYGSIMEKEFYVNLEQIIIKKRLEQSLTLV